MAERTGFEPAEEICFFNGLANRHLKPLSHLSVVDLAGVEPASVTISGQCVVHKFSQLYRQMTTYLMFDLSSLQSATYLVVLDGDVCLIYRASINTRDNYIKLPFRVHALQLRSQPCCGILRWLLLAIPQRYYNLRHLGLLHLFREPDASLTCRN